MYQQSVIVPAGLNTDPDHAGTPLLDASSDGCLDKAHPWLVEHEGDRILQQFAACVSDQRKRVELPDIDSDEHRPGRTGLLDQPQETGLILTTNKRHDGTSSD